MFSDVIRTTEKGEGKRIATASSIADKALCTDGGSRMRAITAVAPKVIRADSIGVKYRHRSKIIRADLIESKRYRYRLSGQKT